MFGGAKPGFSTTAATTGFGSFSAAATPSPFGQSTFGKPATSAFGAAPTFGTQQTTPSLFGTAGQTQTTGLFGAANTSTAFGSTTATQPAFGGFSQPQQTTSIFGATQPAANTSLFGQPSTSAFGSAVKPAGLGGFGQTTTPGTTSLFGQPTAATGTGFGAFGQAATAGSNVFAAANTANSGTSVAKYQPTMGTDTLMKGGQANNVNTKQHCITAMKEYEMKSLEELRMEDYLANRRGPQAGTSTGTGFFGTTTQNTTGTGLFGSTTQQTTGLFGQQATGTTENKGLFGASTFGQSNTSAFGAAQQQNSFLAKPFGAPATTGFGTTTTDGAANPFGTKPAFGQAAAPSLFGQTSTASAAPAFGQASTGFGGFGANTNTQQPSLFGNTATDANKPAFSLGTSTANTGFTGFGTTATSGGMFGAKPTTGFGTAPAYGATSLASNTGFSNFTLGGTNTSGGLFNSSLNKPANTGFSVFNAPSSSAPLNFNTGSNSVFGNTANKPGGLFGNTLGTGTNNTGGALFSGGTGGFGTGGSLGCTFSTNTLGGTSLGATTQQQQVPIHQQILSKVTSPYGDNPIFKDLKRSDENDTMRATNPAAQKAIIESTSNQFKVTAKPSPTAIKIKPVGSALTKKSLFEGLEEFDSSVESFSLKPNAKRLILKPKSNGILMNANSGPGSLTNSGANSQNNTPTRQLNNNLSNSIRNESFSGEIPTDPPAVQADARDYAQTPGTGSSTHNKENDISRRESWLHPNNLEKIRQQNANADAGSPLNNTLSDLMPRKPLETYRPKMTGRPSVSTVHENPFEDQASMSRRETISFTDNPNESIFSSRSYGTEERSVIEDSQAEYEEHPTGIILRRIGYYTIPSMDDLKSYLAEDGSCVVPNFTVGREGYGNVYFGKEMDVAGLNLDEIVHFRNKEVIIYPDDDNKPPIGSGLNREAQVTLDQVWPHDKTNHEPIKDPQRLADMDWEGKLRRVCDKNDTRFVEYRPETGSWVFRVKHFSKYGLNDSDEEDDHLPSDPKIAKMATAGNAAAGSDMLAAAAAGTAIGPGSGPVSANSADKITMASLKNAQKISEDAARALDPKALSAGLQNYYPMDESAEFMLMDKTQYFQNNNDFSMFDQQPGLNVSTSPTAVMAKNTGASAHKLQLMKASFFMRDEQDSMMPRVQSPMAYQRSWTLDGGSGLRSPQVIQPPIQSTATWKEGAQLPFCGASESSSHLDFGLTASPLLPASSSGSVASGNREMQTEDYSPAPEEEVAQAAPVQAATRFIVKPKVAPVKSVVVHVPFRKSLAFPLRCKWPNDLGLYKSRHFKLAFGPQNTLIVPVTYNNMRPDIKGADLPDVTALIFKSRADNDFSSIILQLLQIKSALHTDSFDKSIGEHLNIQLRNSVQNVVEGSECPWLKASGGTELIMKHLDEAVKLMNMGPLEEYAVSVWSLCLALWGDHEELEGRDPSSHWAIMCRRNLLSDWLENELTDSDLLTKNVSKHTYLDHLLKLILCHKVTEACELAFMYDDANLAMLLSQLSGGPVVRQLMEDQLAAWHKDEADKFIQLERLKLFMLVAGVSLMNSSQGPINTLEGIDWLKVLALQLWYFCSPTSSITDALLAYEKSFKADEFYSAPPMPNYNQKLTLIHKHAHTIYDLRYHLLKLFSKRSHPLEPLLNPATHTADPLDYRLSWLLLQTLEALGYHHCSPLSEGQLHVGFASQLESNGMWEWAVFVLLHIKERNQRELAVQDLLYRFVSVSSDTGLFEKEKFVIVNLGVPEKWIDYAKAVKAGAIGDRHMQAKYLLKAKQWNLAHEIIFQYIAPDAVINDNLDYLHELLSQFEAPELNQSNIKVPNWSNQGQIFLDFIDIQEKFKSLKTLKTEADIEARWENLKPQLADLCSRINLLPCPTPKHRLCQSEIAQNLACLLRGVLLVCPALNPCLIIKIALERLPLPQEFAQQELRALLDALVNDLAKHDKATPNVDQAIGS